MGILTFIADLLKGGRHAERLGYDKVGRCGSECRILCPFSLVCEQAVSDFSHIRMLARACADERGRDIGSMQEDPIRRESRSLIAAAKLTDCFVEIASIPGTRYTIRTGESEVRWVQKDQVYHKIKNPFAKLHLKRHSSEYVLFEHIIHNVLFPDCRLDFLGVAEDYHEARLVYRQKAVRSDSRPDDAQIAEYLVSLELKPESRYSFGNDYVFVTDVGQDGDNVLMDDDGNIRFIDPIIGFKKLLQHELLNAIENENDVKSLVSHILCSSIAPASSSIIHSTSIHLPMKMNQFHCSTSNLQPPTSHRGFTMIEMLVVIGILGILMAVLLGAFSGSSDSARAAKCQANMHNLAMAVQSYAMSNTYYPYAGSFQRKQLGGKAATLDQGWIGSNSPTYPSPYATSDDSYEDTLEKGTIWASMKGARDCYVCPTHVRYAKEKNLGVPMWSYAMNAYFKWGNQEHSSGFRGIKYSDLRRSDRFLLFAEIQINSTKGAEQENDPVLQYQNCDGGGDESIGFNHTTGKTTFGNVCFADGHVEKIVSPKSGNVKDLTEWLCKPMDDNGDFDVIFDGSEYKQIRN